MEKAQAELRQDEKVEAAVDAKDLSVQLVGYSAEAIRAPRNREEALKRSGEVLKAFFPEDVVSR
jgi:hypothetical protein